MSYEIMDETRSLGNISLPLYFAMQSAISDADLWDEFRDYVREEKREFGKPGRVIEVPAIVTLGKTISWLKTHNDWDDGDHDWTSGKSDREVVISGLEYVIEKIKESKTSKIVLRN